MSRCRASRLERSSRCQVEGGADWRTKAEGEWSTRVLCAGCYQRTKLLRERKESLGNKGNLTMHCTYDRDSRYCSILVSNAIRA